MKPLLSFIATLACFSSTIYAQDFTLYPMHYMQQRTFINPAFIPKSNVQVGIPGISSIGLNAYNSGFKYSDLVVSEGDSLRIDVANMLAKLGENNLLGMNTNLELISFGFKLKNNYFHAAIRENFTTQLLYPKDFFSFLWEGNGPSAGQEMSFGFGLNVTQYREFSLSYARQINDKLNVGASLKMLKGIANLSTEESDITMLTNPDSAYDISLSSNIQINSSGLLPLDTNSNADYNISGKGNSGFAIDLGLSYQLNDKITLSGSVLNLGSIKWTNQVINYQNEQENASYTYQGLPLSSFFNSDSAFSESMEQLADSINHLFQLDSTFNSYKTSLPLDVRLGFEYHLMAGQSAGANLLWRSQAGSSTLGVSLFYSSELGRWLSAVISYSYYNRSWTNLGLGLRLNGGPVQLHIMSDNIFSVFMPQHAQYANVRAGLNLTFGGKAKKIKLD